MLYRTPYRAIFLYLSISLYLPPSLPSSSLSLSERASTKRVSKRCGRVGTGWAPDTHDAACPRHMRVGACTPPPPPLPLLPSPSSPLPHLPPSCASRCCSRPSSSVVACWGGGQVCACETLRAGVRVRVCMCVRADTACARARSCVRFAIPRGVGRVGRGREGEGGKERKEKGGRGSACVRGEGRRGARKGGQERGGKG